MLEFSSTVLPAPSPYLKLLCFSTSIFSLLLKKHTGYAYFDIYDTYRSICSINRWQNSINHTTSISFFVSISNTDSHSRDVNFREISFPGFKAQIPGLGRVSIWTSVIGLANQQERLVNGPSPATKTAVAATHRWQLQC